MKPTSIPIPSAVQYEWHDQERIMFVCIDPCTWQGREYDNHSFPIEKITLPKVNTDQWCQAAVAWGAKEILFVAKHTGGFCWWQTNSTEYSIKSTGWKGGKGDVLVDLAKSCAKFGLSMGIYVYPGDESWGAGIGSGGKTRDPTKQEAYNKIFRQQLREAITLAAQHTRVIEIWFDGSCIIEVGDILAEYAPNAVILQGSYATIRWVGNESGRLKAQKAWSTLFASELNTGLSTQKQSTPEGDIWAPMELDVTLYNHFWFWARKNENKRKSLAELLRIYYSSVGQGAVMLLNSTPNTDGLIPEGDMALYQALGAEIERRFGKPLTSVTGETLSREQLLLEFGKKTKVNHCMLAEDTRHGERLRKYTVEGWTGKKWKKLTEGEHVGRKCILSFRTAKISRIRLSIGACHGDPYLTFFGAYFVSKMNRKLIRRIKTTPNTIKNWKKCGHWEILGNQSDLVKMELNLTPYITQVGTWQIRFKNLPQKVQLTQEVLYQAGQPSTPGILTRPHPDQPIFTINRTAVVTSDAEIQLQILFRGPPSKGDVEIRYLP